MICHERDSYQKVKAVPCELLHTGALIKHGRCDFEVERLAVVTFRR
jgi:hypothetical protein